MLRNQHERWHIQHTPGLSYILNESQYPNNAHKNVSQNQVEPIKVDYSQSKCDLTFVAIHK